MSRIHPNTTPGTKSQALLSNVQQLLGSTPNMFTTLAHSSSSLGFAIAGFTGFQESKLSSSLREQIALTVAGVNHCQYCASAHTALGKMNKIDEAELAQNLYARSSNAKTQAVLDFARIIAEKRGHITDADLKAVKDAGYDDSEVIDIVSLVAFNTFTNYINSVAQTEIDFPFTIIQGAQIA